MARAPQRKTSSTALLEEIRSEVQKVAEGHTTLVRGQQRVNAELTQVGLRVGQVEDAVIQGFKDVRVSIDALVLRFDTHEKAHARA